MTRLVGLTTLALGFTLAAGAAFAADAVHAYGDGIDERCGRAKIVSAPYKEQICYAGAHGYAACRWVNREYVVRIPAECDKPVALEDAHKIYRRTPHAAPRGLAVKG